jgi:hypothetical protein
MAYAFRAPARELVITACWGVLPLDDSAISAGPDDDLPIAPIGEWASGVLPMR